MKFVTINLIGSLGDQLFQYAYGRAKSLSLGVPLVLTTWKLSPSTVKKVSALEAFNIQASFADEAPNTFTQSIDRVLCKLGVKNQFFQNEAYFAEHAMIIRDDLTLKFPMEGGAVAVQSAIKNAPCPVSVHIHRRDYADKSKAQAFHGNCSPDYYWQAMTVILGEYSNASFFVFSDDARWVQQNVTLPEQALIVSDGVLKDYEELTLISHCKHHIITNTTLSWWGAWLNPDPEKIVVAPKKWFARKKENPSLSNWVKLDN